jgi:hypothetical protein
MDQSSDSRNEPNDCVPLAGCATSRESASGDQRINPFGVGGEMEIRTGLMLQKQPIDGPLLHSGSVNRQVRCNSCRLAQRYGARRV